MTAETPAPTLQVPSIVTEIGNRVVLVGMNLLRSNCELIAALGAGELIPAINVGTRGGSNRHATEAGTVVCTFGADVTALGPARDPAAPVARISFDYAVQYAFTDRAFFEKLQQSELDLFAAYNTSLHVWPFGRELVHTLSTRMGIPPMILPLLRPIELIGSPEKWTKKRSGESSNSAVAPQK